MRPSSRTPKGAPGRAQAQAQAVIVGSAWPLVAATPTVAKASGTGGSSVEAEASEGVRAAAPPSLCAWSSRRCPSTERMGPTAPAVTTQVWQPCSARTRLMDAAPDQQPGRGQEVNPWPSVYRRLGKDKR